MPKHLMTQGAFRLGRIAGIEIKIDWSLAVVFTLIAFNLGAGLFPAQHPEWGPLLSWTVAICAAVLFFASILAHELSHAIVGRARGIPVQDITLFIFGGVARMTGEPRSAGAEFLMAGVGPLTSLVIGVVCLVLGSALAGIGPDSVEGAEGVEQLVRAMGPAATVLVWLGTVNVVLAIFNLLPGFPLDGGRLLRATLWQVLGDLERATRISAGVGRLLATAMIACGFLMMFGTQIPVLGGGFVQGLWLILIGWFLHTAAMRSYQQMVVGQRLSGVPVARLMRREPAPVQADAPVSEVVRRFLSESDRRCFAVLDGESLAGLVCLADVRKLEREQWDQTPVSAIMTPAKELLVSKPDESAADAVRKLSERDVDQLPVVQDGRVAGILRRSDILRWIEMQELAGSSSARA